MAGNQVSFSPIQVANKDTQLIQSAIQRAFSAIQAPGGMPYVPTTASNWVSPAPISMQSALDRIAALLVTLNSGNPIP